MAITPSAFREACQGKNLGELIALRRSLVESVETFERGELDGAELAHSPDLDVAYQMDLFYLAKVCERISDEYRCAAIREDSCLLNQESIDISAKRGELEAHQTELIELANREVGLRERIESLKSSLASETNQLANLSEGTADYGFSQFIIDDLARRISDFEDEASEVRRKRLSLPALAVSAADLAALEAAICPCCGHAFTVSAITGSFLDRHCPICGGKVDEESYDEIAAKTMDELADEENPARWPEYEARVSALAVSRYLAGEFYLLTGTPLSGCPCGGVETLYSFVPEYDFEGKFRLKAEDGYSIVGGIEGELIVFDLLRRAVSREDSPLFGGKLVPGIALPWGMSRRGAEEGLTSQIDCALLLHGCAFVIETKRWKARLAVTHESMRIKVTRGRETKCYSVRSGPLRQGIEHAQALAKVSPHLNTDWIGKVTVFVNPVSFESDSKRFPQNHNTFIGVCWPQGSSVVKAMEGRANKWSTRERKLSEAELCDFAESLLEEYSQRPLPVEARFGPRD